MQGPTLVGFPATPVSRVLSTIFLPVVSRIMVSSCKYPSFCARMQSAKYVSKNEALEPPELAPGYGSLKHTVGLCNSAPQGPT